MAYPKYSKVDNQVIVDDNAEKVRCPDSVQDYTVRHPAVYIQMKDGKGVCPYCGTTFVHKGEQS